MVFIAAGMGGGTGTGAAAVIARIAKELGILAVGIVTKPFHFEGARRMRTAEAGIAEIRKQVDTLIVIPNQNLFRVANEKTTFAEAFVLADQVLYSGVACIVDLIIKEGLINLDFADVRTIMSGMGSAVMGTGEASGERRASLAAEEAIANPLLDEVSLKGAKGLLLSITGGHDLTLYEVDEAASRVRQEVDSDANIIVGATFDETLGDRVRVSIVASGMAVAGENTAPAASPSELRMRATKAAAAAAVVGEKARAPAPADPPVDDLRRRLSEAIGYDDQPPSHPAPEVEREPSASAARESWRAPGDVVIEEGFSHLTWLAQSARSRARQAPASPAGAQEFKPAPPADIRRGARRMPEVEDFPPLVQREYHSKVAPGAAPSLQSGAALVADGLSRLKILQRIMGRGRHPEDSDADDAANHDLDSAEQVPPVSSEDESWWDEEAAADSDAPAERPSSSVPAFFNRLRK
jgi:cell division protein FtsZ